MKKLLEKLSRSRDFTVSVMIHLIIVLVLACTVVFKVASEPPDVITTDGRKIVSDEPQEAKPPEDQRSESPVASTPPSAPASSSDQDWTDVIKGKQLSSPIYVPPIGGGPVVPPTIDIDLGNPPPPRHVDGIPGDVLPGINAAVKSWQVPGGKYNFTAVLAQYEGGDWNSTVRVQDQKVVGGSLPNLLFLMNKWSKDRITTNEDKVKVVRLDNGEILVSPPPFIFMTGTRDFKLTDAEVDNLRKYIRMGGCVWGDSSVPGSRSRFDLAFKREMKRVVGNIDAEFEALPADHPLFREGYFKQVKAVPAGLNFYREPVSALKLFGEVAVIYTSNDYADMWQIGLDEKGDVDLRRNEHNEFVAINPEMWKYRETYLGNLIPVAKGKESAANLEETYKFGANVIFHLLTRWDEKLASSGPL